MPCLLCCFNFLGAIGCRNCLLKKVAFFPPEKYELKKDGIFHHVYGQIDTYKFSQLYPLPQDDLEIVFANKIDYHLFILTPDKNTQIPVMYIENKMKKSQKSQNNQQKQLIIYSHGNSTDLFHIRETLLELSYELEVNILAYDYQGYGLLDKNKNQDTTDLNIVQSIENVYYFATQQLQYEWYNIILYGQSLGSGPSTFLASNYYTPIFGLILQSPIASGLKVINPYLDKLQKRDLFPNYEMIKFVKCPFFIMHGDNDKDVHILNGQQIFENAQNKSFMPWWVQTANHHDISYKFRSDYYTNLKAFIDYLNALKNKIGIQNLLKQFQADNWDPKFQHIYNSKTYRPKNYENKNENKLKQTQKNNKYLQQNQNHQQNKHDLSFQKSIQMQESKNNNYSNIISKNNLQSKQESSQQQAKESHVLDVRKLSSNNNKIFKKLEM